MIERFALSERQADDILEIRLRQLSRLEGIKIEQEIAELMKERGKLESLLASPARMKSLVAREIREDTKKFGDDRRTLIQPERRASLSEAAVLDEPVTIILSDKGWLRQRQGHGVDLAALVLQGGRQAVCRARVPLSRCADLARLRWPRLYRHRLADSRRQGRRRARRLADGPAGRHPDRQRC